MFIIYQKQAQIAQRWRHFENMHVEISVLSYKTKRLLSLVKNMHTVAH